MKRKEKKNREQQKQTRKDEEKEKGKKRSKRGGEKQGGGGGELFQHAYNKTLFLIALNDLVVFEHRSWGIYALQGTWFT